MNIGLPVGLLFSLVGACLIYLASPNQRWMTRPLPPSLGRLGGSLLLLVGGFALGQVMQPVTASFVLFTWLMLVFSLLPYLGALRRKSGAR